jgi:hypothetical protein
MKSKPLTVMTKSMVLKFLSQRKHLARLVLGLVAVSNSPQIGQRNLNRPSPIFDAMFKFSPISLSIGIELRSLNNSLPVNRLFIPCLPDFSPFFLNGEDDFFKFASQIGPRFLRIDRKNGSGREKGA